MVRSTNENNTYKFNFDRVFDPTSHQQEVYDFAARNIVESVLEGFNGTIFAYGQTSSGKTHTMQGVIDHPEKEGIIPRMIRHLFNFIVNSSSDTEYIVKVSMIEIYMEKIKDLIDPERTNLNVREDKAKGIYIEELSEHYVVSEDEVLDIMKLGSDNRSVAATNMNEHSSRSHSIFIMTIHQNNIKDLSAKTGKLYLVDLAGSEKISKTGATGLTLEEAKTINKSLTTLGMVINSLTDGKSTHIPYRESKLTRVLQESLGGNAKTCLIITCSPSIYNESETLSTLRFGLRAKKIKNKPKINKETTVAELKIEIDKMDKTIQKLNRRIKQLENYIVKNGLTIPLEDDMDIDSIQEVEPVLNIEEKNNLSENNHEENNINLNSYNNNIGNLDYENEKVSFGNNLGNNENTNTFPSNNLSRLTAGFGNLPGKNINENDKIFSNGNMDQINKLNNEYINKINELEEENKTLNEQIEFLHEFISRLDKELESKSNFIENLQNINKKQLEEMDNLKIIHNEELIKVKNHIIDEEKNNYTKLNTKNTISVPHENENNNHTEKNSNKNRLDENINNITELSNNINVNSDSNYCAQENLDNLSDVNNFKEIISERFSIPKKIPIHDIEEEKTLLNDNSKLNSNFIKTERYSNLSENYKENKEVNFNNNEKNNNNDMRFGLIKRQSIRKNDENNYLENFEEFEKFQSKSADKEETHKKDLTLLEIFQKLKDEKKITKSINFFQLENILGSSIVNQEISKKNFACQTENIFDQETINNKINNNDNILNSDDNQLNNENLSNKNLDRPDFIDFISKIENLKEKIIYESNLIDKMVNSKINNNDNTNDINDENKYKDNKDKIPKTSFDDRVSNRVINENSQMNFIISQLNMLIREFKENSKKFTNENTSHTIKENQNIIKEEKVTEEKIDEIINKEKIKFEKRMSDEKRKHENEKKTILKVLEEKCEKFNNLQVENGDLNSQIKSLKVKMSPDEKINKKMFLKLEQNIDQLNLILEKTVSEKTQIAINLKVNKIYYS